MGKRKGTDLMNRIYNNEGDEIGGDSGGKQDNTTVGTAQKTCPHTMVAKGADGVVYCCDCGHIIKEA